MKHQSRNQSKNIRVKTYSTSSSGSVHKNGKFKKNSSFVKRSKQMEEFHRKQHSIEENNNKLKTNLELQFLDSFRESDVNESDESQLYDHLVHEILKDAVSSEQKLKLMETVRFKEVINSKCGDKVFMCEETKSNEIKHANKIYSDNYKTLKHFDYNLTTEEVEILISAKSRDNKMNWCCGTLNISQPLLSQQNIGIMLEQPDIVETASDIERIGIKQPLSKNIPLPFTLLQSELFSIFNCYMDLYFPQRTLQNAEEIRQIYCLHALNHILKSRALILRNNEKLAAISKISKNPINEMYIPEKYRDQGLMRLKVVIIVPFRDSAFKVINQLIVQLYGESSELFKKNGTIANYKRLVEDFTGNTIRFPKTNPKPEDYERIFTGNTDDNFKVGLRFTKKSLTLFSDVYAADILVASPLALRMLIGASGTKDFDHDFLNSIEMLIIDQAELYLAQNWETLFYALDHLHLQPQKFPQTNCQRIRNWCLNGLSRFYRQTLLISSYDLPEFRSVVGSKCQNYRGCVRVSNPIVYGDIRNVNIPVQQVFRYIHSTNLEDVFEDRFQYFTKDVLPNFTGPSFAHCLVFVPSYFDFVRLRNYFKTNSMSFVQINEYTKKEKLSRARDMFFHSGAHFMLYSERAHFYRRIRIKGIRNLIMYQPPNWPHFYSEIINFMLEANQNSRDGLHSSMSVTVLYTKYDVLTLSNIIGTNSALKLVNGKKSSYIFSSES